MRQVEWNGDSFGWEEVGFNLQKAEELPVTDALFTV